MLEDELLPLTLTKEEVSNGYQHPLFSFNHTEPEGFPSTATLIVHESNELESVGLYEIVVTEYYWEHRDLFFSETILVEIIDPCTLSKLKSPSGFDITIDEWLREIKVEWDAFEVTPSDEEYCPPVATIFTVIPSSGF